MIFQCFIFLPALRIRYHGRLFRDSDPWYMALHRDPGKHQHTTVRDIRAITDIGKAFRLYQDPLLSFQCGDQDTVGTAFFIIKIHISGIVIDKRIISIQFLRKKQVFFFRQLHDLFHLHLPLFSRKHGIIQFMPIHRFPIELHIDCLAFFFRHP